MRKEQEPLNGFLWTYPGPESLGKLNSGTILALGALVETPVIFGAFGFVSGATGAFFYNCGAKHFGGAVISNV